MSREIVIWVSVSGAAYAWLCAIVAPWVTAARSFARERASRRAVMGLALATAAAILWTIVPPALLLLAMLLEPRAGLALVTAHGLAGAFAAGICGWLLHLSLEGRMPRLGDTCEIAAAMAIVAAFDDSERTLAGVERLYRAVAIAGVSRARPAAAAPRTAAGT